MSLLSSTSVIDPWSKRASEPSAGRTGTSGPTETTTILLVAAHALIREGLRSILNDTPGLSVVGDAEHIASAVAVAVQCKPDVVLLDEPPKDSSERSALMSLRREVPRACVLCLARESARPFEGVHCVPASAGLGELCSVLDAALGGACAACLLKRECVAPRIAIALSPRERQVAVCVARGLASKQIAATLGIALRTVNTYRESLARKLGASSAAVVTRFVLEAKLDAPGLPVQRV